MFPSRNAKRIVNLNLKLRQPIGTKYGSSRLLLLPEFQEEQFIPERLCSTLLAAILPKLEEELESFSRVNLVWSPGQDGTILRQVRLKHFSLCPPPILLWVIVAMVKDLKDLHGEIILEVGEWSELPNLGILLLQVLSIVLHRMLLFLMVMVVPFPPPSPLLA